MKKIVKQAIALLLTVVMIFCSSPMSDFVGIEFPDISNPFATKVEAVAEEIDADAPKIVVSNVRGSLGRTVDVTVSLENNTGIVDAAIKLNYDNTKLKLVSVTNGGIFSDDKFLAGGDNSLVPYSMIWEDSLSTSDYTSNGCLATLSFEILETAELGITSITITYNNGDFFDKDLSDVNFEVVNGSVEITDRTPGDANDDGIINLKDVAVIRRHIAGGWNVIINESNADVNADDIVNLKDAALIKRYIAGGWDVELDVPKQDPPEEDTPEITVNSFVYGTSELGRELVCYELTDGTYDKTILMNFAIHGFEDEYNADAQVLVDTANELIDYYGNVESLSNTRLLIVPCANPDGLYEGTTNNGFGRCNANGVDLNRDFDANYVANTTVGRNYTPYAFSAAESRALRDLYNTYNPEIVLDFHGWLDETIGDTELAQVFYEELGLTHYVTFTSTNCKGYFANWAHQQGSLGLLVEFTNSTSVSMPKLKNAINRLIEDKYDTGEVTGDYSVLENKQIVFMAPQRIDLGTNAYIAQNDICIINSVDLENGTCAVTYPSGGSNVFTSGQVTKQATIKLSYILGYNDGYTVERYSTDVTVKVYPTNSMTANGTNWSLDPGDNYYTLNETDNATAVLYYCSTGAHAGYWKLGWIFK